MQTLSLYTYFRSSAAFRVRIALNLKGLAYESKYIHLLKNGGQEKSAEYEQLNSQKLIPCFADGDHVISQSLAIIEYLNEKYPEPELLPEDLHMRAQVRSLALSIACDIHPLNNLRVLQYLDNKLGVDERKRIQWMQHWIAEGFSAIETQLHKLDSWDYCFSSHVSMADLVLIPQVYNAMRYACDMRSYPRIHQIYQHCMQQAEFVTASPEEQADCDI